MVDARLSSNPVLAAAILGVSIVAGGALLGANLAKVRLADRAVTLRGLAERDVVADLATWTIAYSATGANVTDVQAKIDADTAAVVRFLGRFGFRPAEIAPAGVSVNQWIDNNPAYGPGGRTNVTVRQRLQLRTPRVMDARRASASLSELVRAGVALEEGSNVTYSFTKLDQIKPAMIAEATRDARAGAERFAADSGAAVGGIKTASQGYFSIGSRDGEEGPGGERGPMGVVDTPYKKVRVVTTIDFYLDD
jgi:hypothetical protein